MDCPVYSVIVPVYNVEKYLIECIESIRSQTFSDFEVLLIDDGSTDNSGQICDLYVRRDNRFKAVHKKNCGLSASRNVGLRAARGQYIWFLDSDDYLSSPAAFQKVKTQLDEYNAELCLFGYAKLYENKKRNGVQYDHNWRTVQPDFYKCIADNAYKALAWNKVVKRSLVEDINMRFPERKFAEDLPWCADLIYNVNKFCVCPESLVAYRQRTTSLANSKIPELKERQVSDSLEFLHLCIEKYDREWRDGLMYHYLAYEFSHLIAWGYPFWNIYQQEFKMLSFLLDYDLSIKVQKVKRLKKIVGLKKTAFLLNVFIRVRAGI